MSMNIKFSQTNHDANHASSRLKRLSTTIALGVLLLVPFTTEAQAEAVHNDPIVGTWNVVADIYDCVSGNPIASNSQALALFNADGTRHETNATNPALRSPGYGNWRRVKRNEYEFAFKFYRFDATGVYIGSTNIRHDLFMEANKSSYYSEGTAEILNPAGDLLFVACSDAKATRYE